MSNDALYFSTSIASVNFSHVYKLNLNHGSKALLHSSLP